MATQSKALVARAPFSEGKWAIEPVTLRDLKDDEVLVEIVASGICHTDLHCGNTPDDKGVPGVFYPRVLGHEGESPCLRSVRNYDVGFINTAYTNTGSGYVRKAGSSVSTVGPGDPVLLSFSYCGTCHVCEDGPPSHCINFFDINFIGEPVFSTISGSMSPEIGGRFFGQSSFARHTIVSSKSVVNVSSLSLSLAELRLLAPLGK